MGEAGNRPGGSLCVLFQVAEPLTLSLATLVLRLFCLVLGAGLTHPWGSQYLPGSSPWTSDCLSDFQDSHNTQVPRLQI